ncbi:MAG: metal-dependent hydrolase [Candidatus Paceibacterota bacterium]|jgi:membrane-bound metal-dependent hydrolase YbcI (DUF457 family)
MVLPGHLSGGYLATYSLLALTHASFSPLQTSILYTIGIIAGEIPDIDLLFFYLEYRKDKIHKIFNHRYYITHTPALWLAISLLTIIFGLIFNSVFTIFIGLTILIGSWSHFVLDSIEYGIRWIWPISNRRFFIRDVPDSYIAGQRRGTFSYYWKYISSVYITRWSFYLEILITIVALLLAFKM